VADDHRGGAGEAALHSLSELLLRRLRFYLDLLRTGCQQALSAEPLPVSLRAERIALGIDVPELDAVPLWSVRGREGTIGIPFVEFILAQIAGDLEALSAEIGPIDPSAASRIDAVRRTVGGVLREAGTQGGPLPSLPRLSDVFVPVEALNAICAPAGCVAPVLELCEALVGGELAVTRH
jgi:hypothetical protein